MWLLFSFSFWRSRRRFFGRYYGVVYVDRLFFRVGGCCWSAAAEAVPPPLLRTLVNCGRERGPRVRCGQEKRKQTNTYLKRSRIFFDWAELSPQTNSISCRRRIPRELHHCRECFSRYFGREQKRAPESLPGGRSARSKLAKNTITSPSWTRCFPRTSRTKGHQPTGIRSVACNTDPKKL